MVYNNLKQLIYPHNKFYKIYLVNKIFHLVYNQIQMY